MMIKISWRINVNFTLLISTLCLSHLNVMAMMIDSGRQRGVTRPMHDGNVLFVRRSTQSPRRRRLAKFSHRAVEGANRDIEAGEGTQNQKKRPIYFGPNEFCRVQSVDRVLRLLSTTSSFSQSFVDVDVAATVYECRKLASRFDLPDILSLSAALQLRPEKRLNSRGGSVMASSLSGTSNSDLGILVAGSFSATFTRRCVRTNELFDVTIEDFPVECVVRPVVPSFVASPTAADADATHQKDRTSQRSEQSKREKSHRRKNGLVVGGSSGGKSQQALNLQDLQRLLRDEFDIDGDSLMEDEAIYPRSIAAADAGGGLVMDVGELIAQLFWLSLDPYPKKPGSEFIQRSITG
jgi:hypothetical protein